MIYVLAIIMIPLYIALWILAAHIQYLMQNKKTQDRFWIYPVFTMIGISFLGLILLLLH